MALDSKKYERIFSKSGSDADKISTNSFNEIKEDFDENRYLEDASQFSVLGPVLYQLQQMQDELDELRTEISSNKDKTAFPGFGTSSTTALAGDTSLLALGTSSTTALAGDTTTISTSQASAITANTAKTGISTSQASEITANTAKVSQGLNTANTTMQFDVTEVKGNYYLTITVVDASNPRIPVTKTVTLTLS